MISRYHCLLDINPPDIRIRDFDSLNGTYVNGECIGRRSVNQTPEKKGQNFSYQNTILGSIEGYTKIQLLGRGGCGEVYLARYDDRTGRKLALLEQ
jgi:pSer/pThr/pTyr-binding forkhead associated (FHA) protein